MTKFSAVDFKKYLFRNFYIKISIDKINCSNLLSERPKGSASLATVSPAKTPSSSSSASPSSSSISKNNKYQAINFELQNYSGN